VTISGFALGPASTTVNVGDTVTWTNVDSAAHTVTALDGSFDSGPLAPGAGFVTTGSERRPRGIGSTPSPAGAWRELPRDRAARRMHAFSTRRRITMAKTQSPTSFAQPRERQPRLTGKMFVSDYRSWDRVLSELTGRPVGEPVTSHASVPPETQAHTQRTALGSEASAAH
jgi:hypothetical protein